MTATLLPGGAGEEEVALLALALALEGSNEAACKLLPDASDDDAPPPRLLPFPFPLPLKPRSPSRSTASYTSENPPLPSILPSA